MLTKQPTLSSLLNIHPADVHKLIDANEGEVYSALIHEIEKALLPEILVRCQGNQTKAAEMLGINRGTFREKLKRHNIL